MRDEKQKQLSNAYVSQEQDKVTQRTKNYLTVASNKPSRDLKRLARETKPLHIKD